MDKKEGRLQDAIKSVKEGNAKLFERSETIKSLRSQIEKMNESAKEGRKESAPIQNNNSLEKTAIYKELVDLREKYDIA